MPKLSMVKVFNTCLRKKKCEATNIYQAFDAMHSFSIS